MTLQEKLKQCQLEKTALLATNFYNFETLHAVLTAASEVNSPVLLQLTKSSIDYMGLEMAVAMARQGLTDYNLTGWIHLDHGNSIDLVQRCLDAGFDSVMIDASEKSLEENIETTLKVVEIAKKYKANVEAELGFIAKLGQNQDMAYTTVDEATRFVTETGIDALAIAIGSAHGFYKSTPHLNIDRLKEIHEAIPTVLVLHGSSGIPHVMVQEAIRNGISKVNLATEIKDNFMRSLKEILFNSNEIDLRKVFPAATLKVKDLLIEKYKMVDFEKRN
jgi:fructose-bisphosphate aldolase class II/tagatose 1,6-diphosphate aldolase GatY/KbaY